MILESFPKEVIELVFAFARPFGLRTLWNFMSRTFAMMPDAIILLRFWKNVIKLRNKFPGKLHLSEAESKIAWGTVNTCQSWFVSEQNVSAYWAVMCSFWHSQRRGFRSHATNAGDAQVIWNGDYSGRNYRQCAFPPSVDLHQQPWKRGLWSRVWGFCIPRGSHCSGHDCLLLWSSAPSLCNYLFYIQPNHVVLSQPHIQQDIRLHLSCSSTPYWQRQKEKLTTNIDPAFFSLCNIIKWP